MPTYEYECTRCGRVIELFQPITAKPKRTLKVDCADCSNRAPVRRLIGTGGGIIFKGNGFYETDYRSESYRKAAKADSEAAQPKEKDTTGSKDKSSAKGKDKGSKAKAKAAAG